MDNFQLVCIRSSVRNKLLASLQLKKFLGVVNSVDVDGIDNITFMDTHKWKPQYLLKIRKGIENGKLLPVI